jgi:hypothetical protein
MPLQQAENRVDALLDDAFESEIEINYVTSSPSAGPSVIPSQLPTSTVPTVKPSITGAVAIVEMSLLVTESVSDDELTNIVALAEASFGVQPGNVVPSIEYDITGVIKLDVDEESSVEEVESSLRDAIALSLNVHPSDIEVSYDPQDGSASYTISSATAEEAASLQESLNDLATREDISAAIATALPLVSDISIEPEDGVYANVELIIDTTNTENVDTSIIDFKDSVPEWIIETEVVFITAAPTFLPSTTPTIAPSTRLPSVTPSITGLVVRMELSRVATSSLSEEEISSLTNSIVDAFEVSPEDVQTEVSYIVVGEIDGDSRRIFRS